MSDAACSGSNTACQRDQLVVRIVSGHSGDSLLQALRHEVELRGLTPQATNDLAEEPCQFLLSESRGISAPHAYTVF
jgi:hypothetical protein